LTHILLPAGEFTLAL